MATGTIPMERDVLLSGQWEVANTQLSDTVSITTKSTKSGTFTLSKSGYIPYSIVGYRAYNSGDNGANSPNIHVAQLRLNGNTITYQIYNAGSGTAYIAFYVQVLYFKE